MLIVQDGDTNLSPASRPSRGALCLSLYYSGKVRNTTVPHTKRQSFSQCCIVILLRGVQGPDNSLFF